MSSSFNERFRQIALMLIIAIIGYLLIVELKVFVPGFLAAITLYILTREYYFTLTEKYKWKGGLASSFMIFIILILIALPIFFSIELISPKIRAVSAHQDAIMQGMQVIAHKIEMLTGVSLFNGDNAKTLALKITAFIPQLLNGTAVMLANILMMFFVYFFMLSAGRKMEAYLIKLIPLQPQNIDLIAKETKMMVKANALGIPLICVVQGVFATIGFWIFGVKDWALWGFLSGAFAFFPMVGTMIIWVPLVAYMYAMGIDWQATALGLYMLLITGNMDYVARLTFMKKMGDVHPLITVLGVIVGLNLFGFVGLIFGPLLISYFIVLVKIYLNEFLHQPSVLDSANESQG